MLIKWGLDTCVDTRIVTTANTESQLLTKTAPEITKWSNLAITPTGSSQPRRADLDRAGPRQGMAR
jgi:hypothetical protein